MKTPSQVGYAGLPHWALMIGLTVSGTIAIIAWAEARFVTITEYRGHVTSDDQYHDDLRRKIADLADIVKEHATSPSHGGTVSELREINDRLARIETIIGVPFDPVNGPRRIKKFLNGGSN